VPSTEHRPDPFNDTFVAIAAARAVITATQLGVIDALARQPATADALAAQLQLDPLGVQALLTALQTLGYLHVSDDSHDGADTYRPSDAGQALVSDAPSSVAHFVGAYSAYAWDMLGGLEDALKGERVPDSHERPTGHPFWEHYIRGLFQLARGEYNEAAQLVPVSQPQRMLDIAGGHGGFAMAMCRLHPTLTATVLDLPASAHVGRQIVAQEGFQDVVSFRDGDATVDQLGQQFDVVSMFNLLHHLPPMTVQALLVRAHAALRAPGGCLVIGETERTEHGEPPSLNGAMSGLVYFASSGTRNYTKRELTSWLGDAGFQEVNVHRSDTSPWRLLYVARG
jgi:2-polyprenyl-3-methyl-5-hydroxy-6-metoxy-1,4-benzoquinol methylase/DNA-binding MarR family transcriptional regulator